MVSRWFPPRFSVKLSKPELVTPKGPTPREKKELSDIDDQASLRYQMPGLWFYENKESMVGIDPAMVIKEGLAKALVFYYPLAGRLFEGPNKKLIVDCNAQGALFLKAEANVALNDLGDYIHSPSPYLDKLQYNVPGSEGITGCPLLLIQVTRFTCGGIALGFRFNHTMVDGYGVVLFLKAICELAQGSSTPSVLPIWDREILCAKSASPNPTSTHAAYEPPNMRNHSFIDNLFDFEWWTHKLLNVEKFASLPLYFFFPKILRPIFARTSVIVGPKQIQALRDQATAQGYGPCSTFELIAACLWKCRTIALRPNPDAIVRVTFPTDIRQKLKPVVSPGYYGNAIVMQSASSPAKLLCEGPITYAIQLIREAKNKVDADHVKSVTDFMVANGRPRMSALRNMLVSDISRIGMEKIDFGWGDAMYAGASIAAYGATFLERPKRCNNGSNDDEKRILVPISLPRIYMLIFKREFNKMTTSS